MRDNIRNNAPIPPDLPHEPTVYRIYVIKITDLVGEIIRNKNSHKELKSFLYERDILHSNAFDLVDWTVFKHMVTRVPHLFYICVVKMCLVSVGEMT